MLVLYERLTLQPACVFRGLNKGLKLVVVDSRMHAAYAPLPPYHALRAHVHAPCVHCVRSAYAPLTQHEQPTQTSPNPAQAILTRAPHDHTLV